MREGAIDGRFFLEEPKKRKKAGAEKTTTFWYEVSGMPAGSVCANCSRAIMGSTALFIALITPGPFCRPECIQQYYADDHLKQYGKRLKYRHAKYKEDRSGS